jgi:pimeloyl-ACP methyl ester carboxylesterase
MAKQSPLQYTPLPDRAQKIIDNFFPSDIRFEKELAKYRDVKPRPLNQDGDTEELAGVIFTHHFVEGPGDVDIVKWHYVEAGDATSEPMVFLHGIPDSWWQWHHQMSRLSTSFRCIAVDLKGYGQSEKEPGDYSHEGASEQLFAMLQLIGVGRFNLVTHDRGTVQGDFITANHPYSVIRYMRGEQHLYHFNPSTAPQGALFRDAPWSGLMNDPKRFVVWVYDMVRSQKPIPQTEMERTIQEFSYEGINKAVPRYFNASSFRMEWLQRRTRLLAAWKCPVLIMQGYDSRTQPREFYDKAREYIPNSERVAVQYIPGGHFWTLESPDEVSEAIEKFVKGDLADGSVNGQTLS